MKRFLRKPILFLTCAAFVAAAGIAVAAQSRHAAREGEPNFRLPDEVKPFVEAGTKAIALAEADLNGDGTLDYLVVLEMLRESPADTRPTLIVVRDANGRLTLAGRNKRVVFCRRCVSGPNDPLQEITVEPGGFSITNRAGDARRWIGSWDFKYSPLDRTWQLARVVQSDYDAPGTKPFWTKTYAPPVNFGRIAFADFDPADFEGRGARGARRKKAPVETRAASIFLLKGSPDGSEGTPVLVPVKRRVAAAAPLAGAIEALLEGSNDEDEDGIHGFIFGLKFVAARIKNKTARIDFEYDRAGREDGEEFIWGATMRAFFPEAVERTALQFEGVERVVVCVEGLRSYDSPDSFYHRKCPKNWWAK